MIYMWRVLATRVVVPLFLVFETSSAASTFSREIARIDIGKSAGACIGIPGSPAYTPANETRS
jgi:hypothetical protein